MQQAWRTGVRPRQTHPVEQVSRDAVFESVQALVAAGEYLDNSPAIEETASISGGGRFLVTPEHRYRRVCTRGTPEYLQARRAGLLERLRALPTASAEAVEEAESVIRYRLPSLLRRLYLEVGNEGFGPGYGVLGLTGGRHDDLGRTALDWYRQAHDTPESHWPGLPASVLPLCHWGCAIYSLIDCSDPEGLMWGWDPNLGPEGMEALFPQPLTLAQWLDRWVRGNLHQPTLVQDPTTQEWRGATDEEYAQRAAALTERFS